MGDEFFPKLEIRYSIGAVTTQTTETKIETSLETPSLPTTITKTLKEQVIVTTTAAQTLKEIAYVTVTSPALTPSSNFIIMGFIVGFIIGLIIMYFMRSRLALRKPKHPPKETTSEPSPAVGIKYCTYCGIELNPLGATGKSVCPKCNKIYGLE